MSDMIDIDKSNVISYAITVLETLVMHTEAVKAAAENTNITYLKEDQERVIVELATHAKVVSERLRLFPMIGISAKELAILEHKLRTKHEGLENSASHAAVKYLDTLTEFDRDAAKFYLAQRDALSEVFVEMNRAVDNTRAYLQKVNCIEERREGTS